MTRSELTDNVHGGGPLDRRTPVSFRLEISPAAESNVNARCRGRGYAPILSHGSGTSGEDKLHAFNPALGDLREVAIGIQQVIAECNLTD